MAVFPQQFAILEGEVIEVQPRGELGYDLYTVLVTMPDSTQAILKNAVSCIGATGGIFDYLQVVHRGSKSNNEQLVYSGGADDLQTVGARVLVALINGDMRRPAIIGASPHPSAINDLPEVDSTESQLTFQFNGVRLEIYPSGKLKLAHLGAPKVQKGGNEPGFDQKVFSFFTMEDDGSWSFLDSENQTIAINRTDKTITASNGDDNIVLDKKTNTLKIEVKGNVEVKAEKDVKVESKGTATVNVEQQCNVTSKGDMAITGANNKALLTSKGVKVEDANGNKVDMSSKGIKTEDKGGNKVTMTAESVRVDGATKVIVEAPQVELGANATEGVIKGQTFLTYFNTHTHPTAVGPSGPPIAPMLPTNLSVKVKVT
jgi:hypothetical protein